ncbi:MAG: hypothetical protein HN478_02040 [Rhodospirillaceae bacterium]|jgi:hypothetical protein|nr:hypothetical protein [Rhodospirillaceae bacterium]MBT4487363.1 hypothetical protein [Rhodospirillaceae bacterium]MBT4687651.1 hypothetical protein [Rhodospirillaceae bacterium]MBT5193887.1 hypothetical protein [Rhodospirillaceae bacterium]MBT5898994.1 hypothetical protein [Rhodospirillaceae bacterium]
MASMELIESEIIALNAEVLANQTLLITLMTAIKATGTMQDPAITEVFDRSVNFLETRAISLGKTAAHGHVVGALGIVEDLRRSFLETK